MPSSFCCNGVHKGYGANNIPVNQYTEPRKPKKINGFSNFFYSFSIKDECCMLYIFYLRCIILLPKQNRIKKSLKAQYRYGIHVHVGKRPTVNGSITYYESSHFVCIAHFKNNLHFSKVLYLIRKIE